VGGHQKAIGTKVETGVYLEMMCGVMLIRNKKKSLQHESRLWQTLNIVIWQVEFPYVTEFPLP